MPEPRLELNESLGNETVEIKKFPFVIGRRVGSDLHLQNGDVSRDHAEIIKTDAGYAIHDKGSRYGTFVNDDEIKAPRNLLHGTRIRLGRSGGAEMVFLVADGDDVTQAPAISDKSGELRQVAALLEGLRALSSARVLDEVLELVMDSAITVSGAERGFIMLANAEDSLELKMARSRDKKTLPVAGFETSRKIPEEVFRTGKLRIEADLLDGDLSDKHAGTVALGIRNVLCVPLRLVRYTEGDAAPEKERRVGVLYLDSREKGTLMSPATGGALETLANEAAVAIQNAELYRAALEKSKLEQEMQTAAEIQQALLPAAKRSGEFYGVAAATIPCRSIGGDFFDYVDLPDGALGLSLGDVSGKGPPAALMGAMIQGSLAALAHTNTGAAATVDAVNTALVRRDIQGRFATLFYGILFSDGRLTYCNAGHNAPMVVRSDGTIERLEAGGMPTGMFDGVDFEEATVTLAPGEYIVIFSDGVSEAMDAEEEEYGDDRFIADLGKMAVSDVEPRLQYVFESVKAFTAGAAQNDDVTAMVVNYERKSTDG